MGSDGGKKVKVKLWKSWISLAGTQVLSHAQEILLRVSEHSEEGEIGKRAGRAGPDLSR